MLQKSKFNPIIFHFASQSELTVYVFFSCILQQKHLGPGDFRKEYTVRYAINAWLRGGFPANKIALGLATYGRPFRLDNADNNGLHVPKSKWTPPRTGKYTRTTGFLSYYEICNKYTVVSENKAGAPYGYSGTDWCGFDTKDSLIQKVKTLVVGNVIFFFYFIVVIKETVGTVLKTNSNYLLKYACKRDFYCVNIFRIGMSIILWRSLRSK